MFKTLNIIVVDPNFSNVIEGFSITKFKIKISVVIATKRTYVSMYHRIVHLKDRSRVSIKMNRFSIIYKTPVSNNR